MRYFLFSLVFVLASCQVATKRETGVLKTQPLKSESTGIPSNAPQPVLEVPLSEPAVSTSPVPAPVGAVKVGIIFGPGALRSYAHVGVIQELMKQRVPVQAVVGIEMGALVAAIFSNKGLPYDVEWQMMKLKQSDVLQKGLLSGQVSAGNVKSMDEFISLALSSNKVENGKVPFACPAFNIQKGQMYLMNRGNYSDLLGFCLAFPPLFKPYQQNVAGVLELKSAVDFLRAKGSTFVIYVDLLNGPVQLKDSSAEAQVLWSMTSAALSRQEKGIDYILRVPVQEFDMLDFSKRRELMAAGQKAASESLSQLGKKLGL